MSLESGTLCAYVCVCVCYMCVYMCICVCVCVWFVCFNRISDSLLSLCNSQPGTHQHLVRGPCMHTHIHTVHEHVRAHTHGLRACACPHTRFTSMCVPTHTVHEHAHAHTHGSRACGCPHSISQEPRPLPTFLCTAHNQTCISCVDECLKIMHTCARTHSLVQELRLL